MGWLCTALPGYPDTYGLRVQVHTMPLGSRPLFVVEPTDHPLAVEQGQGLTMQQVQEKVGRLLHLFES